MLMESEVLGGVMLGEVFKVVSSNPTLGQNDFSASNDKIDLLYICISIFLMY